MNSRYVYGAGTIVLHWLLFLLVLGLVAGGKYSHSLPKGDPQIIGIHKQIGIAVLLLMLFRFFWRLINTKPEPLDSSGLRQLAATLVHMGLYLAVIAQAVFGIAMSQLGGRGASLLGWDFPLLFGGEASLFGMPGFLPADPREAAKLIRGWHHWGGVAIGVLVAVHVFGALYHWLVLKDKTLRRIWFGYKDPFSKKLPQRPGDGE
jgi:cytochrome b561